MIRHEFHDCDEDGFPQTFKQALKREIRRREIEEEMARTAKASEAYPPPDEQRGVFDLTELRAVAVECAYVLPYAALATVGWFAANTP